MAYCAFCSRLIEHISTPWEYIPNKASDYRKWELEKDCDFKHTVQQCTLCNFLYQRLEKLLGKQSSALDEEAKLRRMSLSNFYGPRNHKGGRSWVLCRFELKFPATNDLCLDFAVWADTGKVAFTFAVKFSDLLGEDLHGVLIKKN